MTGFSVASLRLLQGEVGLCPLPGAADDFDAGLAAFLDWRPQTVLSLTPRPEMTALGAGALPEALQAAGVAWRGFGIEDYGVPDPGTEALWPHLSRDLRGVLASGGRVLVHCRGGCGRTGLIVLRLMIEAGEMPDTALARLRAARPCAVETEGQMAWAKASVAAAR
jgi:protein-tyrosine phosphatase